MVASLQRDIISIHPFVDGNGRTSRFFMNSLLVSEGIFPARIMDFDLDIQGTKKQWQEEVWKGVHATHKLHVDLINRLDNGSDLTVSSLFPHLYLEDKISLPKKIKGKRNFDSKKVSAELRKGQFLAYLKQKIKKSKAFYNSILHDPVPTFRTLFVEFKEFYKNHHIKYKTENGLENLEVNLISDDFKKAFQTPVAKNKEAWQNKMKQWYSKDLIWRGLANLDYVESHSDLLNYFKNINPHMVSNRILQTGANTAKQLMNETLKDFRTYNADVISGNYVQMAMDHHMAGKLYYDSYGFSTSYKQIVGKAFAMGAMVVAEYGEHTQLKYQEQIFMRVNVAAYSSYKDLNLSRLKQINEKFSYQYPRQKEVMGIGASDPDSIMVLHIIDKNGNVEQTLARDLHNPNTVHTIDGEYVPHRDRLDHEKILRSDKLF